MAEERTPPYPKNAPGDFYVEKDSCMCCDAPISMAPDLVAYDIHEDEEKSPHCYFKKQPRTPGEVERAIMACRVSCVQAYRYAGNDPKILDRFREFNCFH